MLPQIQVMPPERAVARHPTPFMAISIDFLGWRTGLVEAV
ncbi:hypothetical protein Asd1617_03860 [Shigella dysenteriae 1617]|uniref:Uncharacterized protein n=1 Tax=Shigella dysenteriae 1617 TaxID=754093 RepID=A0A0A6ZXK5_SHIDY|nr:hypothetical protein Asd1617_03860 [Shigella dysenteriae 1617]